MIGSRVLWLCLPWLLLACAAPQPQPQPGTAIAPADFSGSWEMNYARSETARDKIAALDRAMMREAEKRARKPQSQRGPTISVGGDPDSLAALIPLARFAELITSSTIVEIAQTDTGIRISRNDDFTLECDFSQRAIDFDEHPFGSEVCGWEGRDLILRIALPDGLNIVQRLTVAQDRRELRIVTTVLTRGGSKRFSLEKYFYSFEAPPEDYSCQFTLTRGNVCSRKAS